MGTYLREATVSLTAAKFLAGDNLKYAFQFYIKFFNTNY